MYKIILFSFLIILTHACSQNKETESSNKMQVENKDIPKQEINLQEEDKEIAKPETKSDTTLKEEVLENLNLEKNSYTGFKEIKERMQKRENVKIVCFGNSITNGYKVGTYGRVANPYPETLEKLWQKEYNNPNIKVINEGHNGWRVDQAFNQLQNLVIDKKPDLVTIMFGINDAYANYSLPKYMQYLKQIIRQLKAHNIKILLLTPTPIDRPENKLVQKYCQIMQVVSKEENIAFFNIHQTILERKQKESVKFAQLLPDDIHFGDEYYVWIADSIAELWKK